VFILPIALSASVIKDDIMRAAGTRAVGMGGAFVSIADDYSAYYWNPAGLVVLDTGSANVFFDSVFSGKEAGFGANFTYPLPADQTAAFTYMRTNYTSSDFYNDFFYFTYAGWLHDDKSSSFGVNFKFLSLAAGAHNSGGFATSIDAGVMIFPEFLDGKMKIGLVAQDLDTMISWSNNIKERVPVFYKAGASYAFDKTSVAALDIGFLDYGHMRRPQFAFNLGGEKWFMNKIIGNFGVRAGWQWREALDPNSKFAIGASYSRDEFTVNYVYMPGFNNLGDTHKLDFSWFLINREKGGPRNALVVQPGEMARGDIELITEKFKPMQFDISQKYISPNGDKKMDTVDLILKGGPAAAAGVNWKLEIINGAGQKVKEIKGAEIVQPLLTWDGSDDSGKTVKDGDYTAMYAFTMDNKSVWSKTRVVTVDTSGPRFTLVLAPRVFSPAKKAGAKKMEIKVSPKDRDIKSWKLSIRTRQGSVLRKMSGDGFTDRIFWAGDDALGSTIKDGDYEIALDAEDFAGNTYEQVELLTVDTYESKFNLQPENRFFSMGTESVNFVSNGRDTDRIKKWDLEIRDRKANLIKAFRNNGPAIKNIKWKGTGDRNTYSRKGSIFTYRLVIGQKNGMETVREGIVQSLPPDFEGVGIELTLAAIDFPAGSKDIPVAEYGYLNQAAEAVKKYAKNYYVIIKGYATDSGDEDGNIKLSVDRVMAIEEYLAGQGVPEEFIYDNGYGDGEYAGVARKEEATKNGRRVEVELLTK
jgi:outer membrane protein OmpA-like peptidoglycan-associated protein/flagellar hook assembly protein FlgD